LHNNKLVLAVCYKNHSSKSQFFIQNMLFEAKHAPNEIFSIIKHELHRGVLDKKHPFRYVVLSTSGHPGPDSRYVVLRAVDEAFHAFFYTDSRSEKVKALQAQPNAVLLLYHPIKRTQVRIQAKAVLHHQDELAQQHWKKVQGEARKAYNSILPPGTSVQIPEKAFDWNENLENFSFFTVLELIPTSIDLLQLNGLEHLRIRFNYENDQWSSQWLVP
jgi:pyridoxamine 5'-phosphate oxidase